MSKKSINRGISLFGPYGDGHAIFIKDPRVQTGEIHTQGWGALEPEEGVYDWSYIDDYLTYYAHAGKTAAIRIQSAGHSTRETPRWLYDSYGVRQITEQGVFFDFSPDEPAQCVSEKCFTSANDEYRTSRVGGSVENNSLVCGTPNTVVMKSTHLLNEYDAMIVCDYKGTGEIDIVVQTNGKEKVFRSFTAQDVWTSAMFCIPASEFNYESIIKFVIRKPTISLKNVSISGRADGVHSHTINLCYPNYFDPVYSEKYENFIAAFAQRYNDNPHVGAIVVGGFGRWDELTLLGESHEDSRLLTKQWRAYGYNDPAYIAHIDAMCQLFQKYCGEAMERILHVAAFAVPVTDHPAGAGDQNYIGYAVNNMAIRYGCIAKTNGLTEKITEWGEAQNGFQFFANRYKYAPDTKFILETALQVNHPLACWTGHPISLYNRVLIDSVDNIWHYSADLQLPFVMKYAHVFNEQAGNALCSRMYNIAMRTYFSASGTHRDGSTDDRVFRNMWNGIYLKNENDSEDTWNDEHKNNYVKCAGRDVLKTSHAFPVIRYSLDNRQSYNLLYGSVLAVVYFDAGTGVCDVVIENEYQKKTCGRIAAENSAVYKTAFFYTGRFFDTKNNGDKPDVAQDISIHSVTYESVYIHSIELHSVPSLDWEEETVYESVIPSEKSIERFTIDDAARIFEILKADHVSAVEVYIGTDTQDYVLLEAKIFGLRSDNEELLTVKQHYMPGAHDSIRLPVAHASASTESFRVEVTCKQGAAYIFTDEKNRYAYSVKQYAHTAGQRITLQNDEVEFKALHPFFGLVCTAQETADITLYKLIGNAWEEVFSGMCTEGIHLYTCEPQTAGDYKVLHKGNAPIEFYCAYLKRRIPANPPCHYTLGKTIHPAFEKWNDILKPAYGWENIHYNDSVWTADVAASFPVLETEKPLCIEPDTSHVFRFVMKNETASDMVKLYWKNEGDENYTEEKVAYIPVVANDEEFREYSWPIGEEAVRYIFTGCGADVENTSEYTYADTLCGRITGFSFVPVTGHTVTAGRVFLRACELRENSI